MENLSLTSIISISLDAYSAAIGLFILIYLFHAKSKFFSSEKWFFITLIADIIMAVSDIFTFLYSGPAKPENFFILPITMAIYYTSTFAIIISYLFYVINQLATEFDRKHYNLIALTASVLYYGLLFATQFTEILYTIDENNNYTRGKFFYFSAILVTLIYVSIIVLFIKNRKRVSKKIFAPLIIFIIFPITMQLLQIYFNGLSLINVGYTFAFLVLFFNLNHDLEDSIGKKEVEIEEKAKQIENIQAHQVDNLSFIVENRDIETGEHIKRTSAYVEMLATKLFKENLYPEIINSKYIALIEKAAPMHDIGKIVVSDAVLKKPGRLTTDEYEHMKLHTIAGRKIIYQTLTDFESPEYVKLCADIAAYHHEKWDGTGYPEQLKGEEIPLCARIMALADVFDALVSPRVYKEPMSYDQAFAIIEEDAGTHFDPELTKAFLSIKERIIAICESYKSKEDLINSLEELEEV